jgi:phospholipid transport system substrate-binding protein
VIQQGGPRFPIDYAMEKADSGWKVYDVVIDGASLVTTYRGQLQRPGPARRHRRLVKTLVERNAGPRRQRPPKK